MNVISLTFGCRLKQFGYGDLGITLVSKLWGKLTRELTYWFRRWRLPPSRCSVARKEAGTRSGSNFQLGGFSFFFAKQFRITKQLVISCLLPSESFNTTLRG